MREPHVAVEVEIYRPFFLLGEVIAPGQCPYVPNMTVETVIAIAGGFTPRAYRYDAEISRSQSGVTARQKVPMIAPVRPGDTVNIAERRAGETRETAGLHPDIPARLARDAARCL